MAATTPPSRAKFFENLVASKDLEVDKLEECPILWHKIKIPFKTACGHIFCLDCAKQWFEKKNTCPTCRRVLYINQYEGYFEIEREESEDDEDDESEDDDYDDYDSMEDGGEDEEYGELESEEDESEDDDSDNGSLWQWPDNTEELVDTNEDWDTLFDRQKVIRIMNTFVTPTTLDKKPISRIYMDFVRPLLHRESLTNNLVAAVHYFKLEGSGGRNKEWCEFIDCISREIAAQGRELDYQPVGVMWYDLMKKWEEKIHFVWPEYEGDDHPAGLFRRHAVRALDYTFSNVWSEERTRAAIRGELEVPSGAMYWQEFDDARA